MAKGMLLPLLLPLLLLLLPHPVRRLLLLLLPHLLRRLRRLLATLLLRLPPKGSRSELPTLGLFLILDYF